VVSFSSVQWFPSGLKNIQKLPHLREHIGPLGVCQPHPYVSLQFLSNQLAARALTHLGHHEAADAAGVRRPPGLPHRRDDQHQSLVPVAVQVLAEVGVAKPPAADLRRVRRVAY
jgi:hypothetical protein